MVEGREYGIGNREREVILMQLSESRGEVVPVTKALSEAVSIILKPPHKLNHQERKHLEMGQEVGHMT